MWGAGAVLDSEDLKAVVDILAAALGIPDLAQPLGLFVPLTAKPAAEAGMNAGRPGSNQHALALCMVHTGICSRLSACSMH